MSVIKTKRAEKQPAVPSHFPNDYDDDGSEFYVPIEVRDYYPAAVREPYGGWRQVRAELARVAAFEEMEARYPFDSRNQTEATVAHLNAERVAFMAGRPAELLDEQFERFSALAKHRARLTDAVNAARAAEQSRAVREAYAREQTCPQCGEFDPLRRGPVQDYALVRSTQHLFEDPAIRASIAQIHACGVCAEIARQEHVGRLAASAGPSFREPTLRDAIRAAIGL